MDAYDALPGDEITEVTPDGRTVINIAPSLRRVITEARRGYIPRHLTDILTEMIREFEGGE